MYKTKVKIKIKIYIGQIPVVRDISLLLPIININIFFLSLIKNNNKNKLC